MILKKKKKSRNKINKKFKIRIDNQFKKKRIHQTHKSFPTKKW